MDITLETLWNRVLEELKTQVSRPAYETWIKSIVPESLTAEVLTLRVLHSFAKMWLTRYYANSINKIVADILGYPVEIQVVCEPAPKQVEAVSEPPRPPHPGLNPKYTFSRFVVGPNNRMPHAAALAVAEAPGREFNPLFL
ncbi:MAG: DnaA N-terminal domain-containing protein, partial [Pseudanabaenaceae cyanobacterium]